MVRTPARRTSLERVERRREVCVECREGKPTHAIFYPDNPPKYWKVCEGCARKLVTSPDCPGLVLEPLGSYYERKDWRVFCRILERHPGFIERFQRTRGEEQ